MNGRFFGVSLRLLFKSSISVIEHSEGESHCLDNNTGYLFPRNIPHLLVPLRMI